MATKIERASVVIANGSTTSAAVAVPLDKVPLAVVTPSALTGTNLKFEVSDDGGTTYKPVYKEGTEYSVTVSATQARHVALDPAAFRAIIGGPSTTPTTLKVVSGSTEGANRTLQVVFGIDNG
jgi:hypothetical protein